MQSPKSQDELLNSILSRSVSDREFRKLLLADPKAAILNTFGVRVPEHFSLRFVEKPPDLAALIVLPDPAPVGELTDEELEAVAGGSSELEQWVPPTGG